MSPYQAMYKKPPLSLPQYVIGSNKVEHELSEWKNIMDKLKKM